MTLGEYRVGVEFNPSGNKDVQELKTIAAGWIDYLERFASHNDTTLEVKTLIDRAQRVVEDAAMLSVKAVTKPKKVA